MKTFFKTALMAGVALSAALFSGTALWAYHSDVVTCKHDEICHYLSDDGNVYDWNDNLVAPSAGSFIGTDGQELIRTGESSAPFTAVSSNYVGRSFVDQMSISYVNYFLDSSNVLRFCYFGCAHYWPAWGDVKDFDLWAQGNTAAMVYVDGTSNVCTWNDNVSVSVSSGDYNNGDWQRFVCKKTDGTFETSLDSGAEPPECAKSAHGKRFQDWQPASFLYVKADDTLSGTNVGIPSGRWRDVILVKRSLSCWVSLTDRLFKCWDENGNFIKTSTHTVAESVGRPQSVPGCEWTEPTGNSDNGSSVRSGMADAVLDALGLTDLVSGGSVHAFNDEQKAKAEKYVQFLASPDFTAKVSAAGNSKVLWVDLSNWTAPVAESEGVVRTAVSSLPYFVSESFADGDFPGEKKYVVTVVGDTGPIWGFDYFDGDSYVAIESVSGFNAYYYNWNEPGVESFQHQFTFSSQEIAESMLGKVYLVQ